MSTPVVEANDCEKLRMCGSDTDDVADMVEFDGLARAPIFTSSLPAPERPDSLQSPGSLPVRMRLGSELVSC